MEKFVESLIRRHLATPATIEGCSDAEIETIRVARGGYLPPAYEEFLRVAGRRAGTFWCRCSAFYPDVLDLTDADLEQLVQVTGQQLPQQKRIIILSDQGAEYLWLDISSSDPDPPVWQLMEYETVTPRRLADTFTSLLMSEVEPTD